MITETTGYRFLETEEEAFGETAPTIFHSVEFNPSIEDYVYVGSSRSKSQQLKLWTKYLLQAFCLINMIGLPAALLYFAHPILAISCFAFNVFFVIFVLPAILKTDYRKYYRSALGDDFEKEIVRIELTADGVYCRHNGDASFHRWGNIINIEETVGSIYLHLRASSVIVRKSGFSSELRKKEFLLFARERFQQSNRRKLTQ